MATGTLVSSHTVGMLLRILAQGFSSVILSKAQNVNRSEPCITRVARAEVT
jgi:hypothetical protein